MFVFKNHILQPLFNNLDVFQRPKDWQLVFFRSLATVRNLLNFKDNKTKSKPQLFSFFLNLSGL